MRNVMEKLGALLRESWSMAVGVAVQGGALRLACLEKETQWRVKEVLHLPLPEASEGDSLWQEAADAVKVALAKRGWEKSRIAVCLTEEQVFSYRREFPPLAEKEMKEAARWDLLASLPAAEAEAAYCMDFQPLGEREVLLAAMPRGKAQAIHRAFEEAGLCLASLCFLPQDGAERAALAGFDADGAILTADDLPEEEDYAVFWAAAGLAAAKKRIELLPAPLRPAAWAFGRIAAALVVVCFLCMAAPYGWNAWRIHELRGETQAIAQEMALLSAERQRMEEERSTDGRVAQKEQQLISLSKGALPCRSLLVHFGTRTVEGAWIRELRVVDGHAVEVEGAATSYDALANFVRVLEEDKGFFTAPPTLKRSERKQEAGTPLVYFSLELKI